MRPGQCMTRTGRLCPVRVMPGRDGRDGGETFTRPPVCVRGQENTGPASRVSGRRPGRCAVCDNFLTAERSSRQPPVCVPTAARKRRVRWRGLHGAKKGAPACAIVPDGRMKASQGNHPPRAAFTHPAGVAMRRKRERPPGRPCPGGRSTAAGEKGKNPPHRPPGNGWGKNRRPRPCYAEEPGAPYGREAPVRWRVTAGERFGTPLAAIVPARGNPAGGVHASDCMRPGRPAGFGRRDFRGTGSHPGRAPGNGPCRR